MDSQNFKYYGDYINYSENNMTTTIQISEEVRDKIKSLGAKGETYQDIIERLYNIAVKEQLKELLMSSKDTISLEEARERLNKKWPKSK